MEKIDRKDIVELLYAISNVAHAEYHLVETLMINQDIAPQPLIDQLQKLRTIRTSLMTQLSIIKPQAGKLWCIIKHLLLTEFHLFELYERDLNKYYLKQALDVHMVIDEMLAIDGLEQLQDCPRCDDDKKGGK